MKNESSYFENWWVRFLELEEMKLDGRIAASISDLVIMSCQ